MTTTIRGLTLLLLSAAPVLADPVDSVLPIAAPISNVALEFDRGLVLADGTRLSALVYRAADATAAQPCVVTLTPYLAQTYHDRGVWFGARGYTFFSVDARGRGNSAGEFNPLAQEVDDASAVVDAVAAQPECDGRVLMWGGSYAGYNQWTAAARKPKALRAIVPAAAPYPGVDFPMLGHVPYSYDIRWLMLTAGRAGQTAIFADEAHWRGVYRRLAASNDPFTDLDRVAGLQTPWFDEWLAHPGLDTHWAAMAPSATQLAAVDLPILTITGHYDGDQPGALAHYRAHMAVASAAARGRHLLLIGPWDHAGTRTPRAEFGGLRFGPASVVDLNELHDQWYRNALDGAPRPALLSSPVVYYLAGAETWKGAQSLDDLQANAPWLYLDFATADGTDLYASGSVSAEPARGQTRSVTVDPRDTRLLDLPSAQSYTDQRPLHAAHGLQFVFHGPVLDQPHELAGQIEADLWLTLDQPDGDIAVSVHELRADGQNLLLASSVLRLRYREDRVSGSAMPVGKPTRLQMPALNFQARVIASGSRLRVVVAPLLGIDWGPGFAGLGPASTVTRLEAKQTAYTLHTGGARASRLRMPWRVYEPATAQPRGADDGV